MIGIYRQLVRVNKSTRRLDFINEFRKWIIISILLLSSTIFHQALAASVSGKIHMIGDATHIEFSGKDDWNYSVKRISPDKIEVSVPAFNKETEIALKTWSKGYIKHIGVTKLGPDKSYKLTFLLTENSVESFDYLTDQPSRLILDFYKKSEIVKKDLDSKSPKVGFKAKAKKRTIASPKATITKNGYTKVTVRRPSSSELLMVKDEEDEDPGEFTKFEPDIKHGIYDAGDKQYERFRIKDYQISEEAIIASRQNIYIRFPMVNIKFNRLSELLENPPLYKIQPKNNQENKEARLLLIQFNKKRFGGFFKTYKYFSKKYPNSRYAEILGYLAADMNYRLYKKNGDRKGYREAINKYQALLIKYPKSVLAERTELLLAYFALDSKNALSVIQKVKSYLETHKESEEKDRARFALAQGFRLFNKPKDAKRIYLEIEKDTKNEKTKAEAAYRIGDVYFDSRNMNRAIASYKEALKQFPASKGIYPNAYYNMAEAQFWAGEYKDALDNLINFLQLFPDHRQGGYALTRVGELLDIMGAEKSKVIGAYLESYFRYRSSDGAEIARARMISERLHNMKETEVRKSLEEIAQLSSKSRLPKMKEFVTLMVADGLHGRKEYKRALSYLVAYFRGNPTSNNLAFFKKRILKNISNIIRKDVSAGNYINALRFYGENSNTWLRNSDRIDIKFQMGKAYELVGVRKEARTRYIKVAKELDRIKGTDEEKERNVNEDLPTKSSVLLRLAAVSVSGRKYHDADKYIKAIKNTKILTPKELIEKVEIASFIYQKRGQHQKAKSALNKLIKSWAGEPKLLIQVYYRLAKLYYKTRQYSKAEASLGYLTEIHNEDPSLRLDIWAKAQRLLGDTLLAQGRGMAAVKAYVSLLEQFEDIYPLDSVRYKAGLVLFERGDLVGAEKLWSVLSEGSGKTYQKLANEKLGNARWKDEYKKYIDRIPAAKGL